MTKFGSQVFSKYLRFNEVISWSLNPLGLWPFENIKSSLSPLPLPHFSSTMWGHSKMVTICKPSCKMRTSSKSCISQPLDLGLSSLHNCEKYISVVTTQPVVFCYSKPCRLKHWIWKKAWREIYKAWSRWTREMRARILLVPCTMGLESWDRKARYAPSSK